MSTLQLARYTWYFIIIGPPRFLLNCWINR